MHSVAHNRRQTGRGLDLKVDVARSRIRAREGGHITQRFGDGERAGLDAAPLEEPTQPLDYVAGTLVVLANIGEDCAQFVEVWRFVLQKKLRRLGVAQDRAERLVQLVREGGRQLSHHRNAACVGELRSPLQLSSERRRAGCKHSAAHEKRHARWIVFSLSARRNPLNLPVGETRPRSRGRRAERCRCCSSRRRGRRGAAHP